MTIASTAPVVKSAFDVYLEASQYPDNLARLYQNIHFNDMAKSRLSHTVGFMLGLAANGYPSHVQLAQKMATDLHRRLTELNQQRMVDVDGGGKFPSSRYMLHDDGTFGGFSFVLCTMLPAAYVWDILDKTPRASGETYRIYRERIRRQERWSIELPLEYTSLKNSCDFIEYKYYMNGGLLYHGPKPYNEPSFAVNLDNSGCLWSTHT